MTGRGVPAAPRAAAALGPVVGRFATASGPPVAPRPWRRSPGLAAGGSTELPWPRGAVKRIGHKGAHSLAPGNTLASFEAALHAGVDVIEFDVINKCGRLVLAHSVLDAYRRPCLLLKDGLAHLADERYAPLQFNVDLKRPGGERAVVDLVREFGLTERCLVSSQFVSSLDRVRAIEPRIAVGVSVGGFLARRLHRWDGRRLAELVAGQIRAGRFDALMAHHTLVCDRLVELVIAAGGDVYAWTVDDPRAVARLVAAGVAGVTTNDPRVFIGV